MTLATTALGSTPQPTLRPLSTPVATPAASSPAPPTDRLQLSARATRGSDDAAVPAPVDRAWGPVAKGAAVAAGVVGGALIAGAVAAACGFGGMQLGGLIARGMYMEQLPQLVALTQMADVSSKVLLAAPVLGAIGGGLMGAAAARPVEPAAVSQLPGEDRLRQQASAPPTTTSIVDSLAAPYRKAGQSIHQTVAQVGASTLGASIQAGGGAAYTFGSKLGALGGGLMGLVQGACIGGMLAGMPFAFAPLTAIPAAIVGAWGLSHTGATVGSIVGGSVAAPLGAAAGAVGHAFHKSTVETGA